MDVNVERELERIVHWLQGHCFYPGFSSLHVRDPERQGLVRAFTYLLRSPGKHMTHSREQISGYCEYNNDQHQ